MKKMRSLSFTVLSMVFLLVFGACSSTVDMSKNEGADSEGVFLAACIQREYVTFDELISISDVAIVGEYIETIGHEYYTEQKFKVRECLYGDVTDSEIYLCSNIGTANVEEIGYSYESGADVYEEGLSYLLVMERQQSLFYDHDRYMLNADVLLCESSKEYRMYDQSIDLPAETSMRDYVISVYNSVPHPASVSAPVAYENELSEMVGESAYVGVVYILEMEIEGVHNGNSYRCSVESLSKGSNLNTYGDGTILMTILKGKVEVGHRYIIGFSPADKDSVGSLVYVQSTVTSVYDVSDELMSEIDEVVLTENKDKPYKETDYNTDIVLLEDWENTAIGEYPLDANSAEWSQLSFSERAAACNMPKEYVQSLTTEELVDYAVNYPFLMDILAFDHIEDGMDNLAKKSYLFEELYSRADCFDELLTEYLNMGINDTTFADSEDACYTNYGSKVFLEAYIELNHDLLSEEQAEKYYAKRR